MLCGQETKIQCVIRINLIIVGGHAESDNYMNNEMIQDKINEPIHCYGIIIMIDALGTRGLTIEQCFDFFRIRQDLIEDSLFRWKAASNHSRETNNTSEVKIYVQSFADTIVLAVEMKEFGSVHGNCTFPTGYIESDNLFYGMWLERIAYVLGDLIRDGLYKKVVLRGAMAAGEYIIHEKSNSVLGPTVVDVAKHYEEFESIGVILTPTSSAIIDNLAKSRQPRTSLRKTSIPFKNNQQNDLYAVNWPNAFCKEDYSEEAINKAKKDFGDILSEIEIPQSAEEKYKTAKSFFDMMIKTAVE